MAKSVQFPVKQPRDFDTLIRYEGRDINYVDPAGYSARRINTGGSKAGSTSIYQNRVDTVNVPVGKCYWVESISYGANIDGQFQVLVSPYNDGNNDVWGLEDHEVYRAGGKSGVLVIRKWFRELTRFQFAFQSFKPGGDTMFFATLNGVEFTGNAGLNFGANKSMLVCGASTSWYLIGDWRNNVDSYKNVPSGSTTGSVEAVTHMLPNLDGGNGDIPFSGDGLWGNQLIYDFMENGKDWRWVNKSFGGSNFIRNWYGAIQSGYLNGVSTDLLMVDAGVNDANGGAWTEERRTQFKDRLAKFTEWRNRWNPSVPVVYISPVTNDDGFGINLDTGSAYLQSGVQPSDIGYFIDPRTAVATDAPSGSNFDTRNTWDSGSNGEYVIGADTYYMTRIEIARQLVKTVATSSFYGGGIENNVYYVDGILSDSGSNNTIFRQETQNGSGSASYIRQEGLRFAKYYTFADVAAGQSGSISHQAKADGYLPPGGAIIGEIQYFNSASTDMSPYNYTTGGDTITVLERDTEDLLFKYVNTGTSEQISGARLHRSPMGMYNLFQNIKTKLIEYGLYDNL